MINIIYFFAFIGFMFTVWFLTVWFVGKEMTYMRHPRKCGELKEFYKRTYLD